MWEKSQGLLLGQTHNFSDRDRQSLLGLYGDLPEVLNAIFVRASNTNDCKEIGIEVIVAESTNS